jgi:hypothetical protein
MLRFLKGVNSHLLVSLVIAALLLLILFVLCFQFASDQGDQGKTASINLAVFVAGWATGWVAGTLVAPYDKDEATLFSQISKGIWAFASGYLLGKIDPIFSSLRDSNIIPLSDISMFRVLLYLSVTTIVMLVVFLARKYGKWHVTEDQ